MQRPARKERLKGISVRVLERAANNFFAREQHVDRPTELEGGARVGPLVRRHRRGHHILRLGPLLPSIHLHLRQVRDPQNGFMQCPDAARARAPTLCSSLVYPQPALLRRGERCALARRNPDRRGGARLASLARGHGPRGQFRRPERLRQPAPVSDGADAVSVRDVPGIILCLSYEATREA